MNSMPENEKRLAELILYISQRCATDKKFGFTKLNKILYFSDFIAYGKLGKSITGVEYQRLEHGPAPRRLVPVRERMIENKELVVQSVALLGGKIQHRTVNLREPDLDMFTGSEINIVNQIIEVLADCDAETVSELSHQEVGWKVVKDGETIPYKMVFLSDEPLTEKEIARGQEIAKKLGLMVA